MDTMGHNTVPQDSARIEMRHGNFCREGPGTSAPEGPNRPGYDNKTDEPGGDTTTIPSCVPHTWHKRLFAGDDIRRIAELVVARDSKLRVPEGVDVEAVADHLHAAFDNAMRSDLLAERSNDAGRLKGPWFRRFNP